VGQFVFVIGVVCVQFYLWLHGALGPVVVKDHGDMVFCGDVYCGWRVDVFLLRVG
jgi:hypothetical protein